MPARPEASENRPSLFDLSIWNPDDRNAPALALAAEDMRVYDLPSVQRLVKQEEAYGLLAGCDRLSPDYVQEFADYIERYVLATLAAYAFDGEPLSQADRQVVTELFGVPPTARLRDINDAFTRRSSYLATLTAARDRRATTAQQLRLERLLHLPWRRVWPIEREKPNRQTVLAELQEF